MRVWGAPIGEQLTVHFICTVPGHGAGQRDCYPAQRAGCLAARRQRCSAEARSQTTRLRTNVS